MQILATTTPVDQLGPSAPQTSFHIPTPQLAQRYAGQFVIGRDRDVH
ncbi:MAG TPA: hypothetical protein VFO35_18235 [Steroidobacteraceae bacterium]|nr:hypothetical protein [Steroidobacteraceae bacterium]